MSAILLDTSFLITLVDSTRPNHNIAKSYYRLMLDEQHQMYLSSIVVSEFEIKQPISDLQLKNFRYLTFNIPHGIEAARLWNGFSREDGENRQIVKDDVKLIAQASKENIDFIITEDASTLFKYCNKLRKSGLTQVAAIKLVDGYDSDIFRNGPQIGLL